MFGFFSKMFGTGSSDQEIKEVLSKKVQLIDVRTPAEYRSGSAKGAINIPLDRISQSTKELKKDIPVLVFCKSGGRSSQAKGILEKQGFNVINGGSVQNVRSLQ